LTKAGGNAGFLFLGVLLLSQARRCRRVRGDNELREPLNHTSANYPRRWSAD
jgi:hypothetical protein